MTKTLYKNAKLFDGVKDGIQDGSWFVVEDETGLIKDVGTGDAPDAEKTEDLGGKFVMPGLINAHTHIMLSPTAKQLEYISEAEITFNALKNLKLLLNSGVTYIRDCACAFDVDTKLYQLQLRGELKGTGIVPSGRPMTMTGGHGDFTEGLHGETTMGHLVDSPDAMRKAVRENFKLGAKNIKVMATGGIMSSTDQVDDTELSEAEMQVAVEEAHSKHMTVASHAQGNRGIQYSLDAGVDSIEHGIYVDEKQADFMRDNGVCLVPTLIASDSIRKYGAKTLPEYMMRKNEQVEDDFFKNVKMAIEHGVRLVVGTDAGTPFNGFEQGTYDEISLLVGLGLTPYKALLGATQYAAELLRISDSFGTLESGKYADFLVLNNDPLADVENLRDPEKQVYKKGERVK
jgi:imidazolonepropionase-like amidohydrolase